MKGRARSAREGEARTWLRAQGALTTPTAHDRPGIYVRGYKVATKKSETRDTSIASEPETRSEAGFDGPLAPR